MTLEIEKYISDIKKVVPTLNVIITGDTGLILIENNVVYSTQGPVTNETMESYLFGLHRGLLCGLKYIKSNT